MKKIIIIEDEPAARNELEILVAQEEGFQIVGQSPGRSKTTDTGAGTRPYFYGHQPV